MGGFVVVNRAPEAVEAETLSRRLHADARAAGETLIALDDGTWLAGSGPHPPRPRAVGPWTLIGDVIDRRAPVLPVVSADDPWGYEKKMMARLWGRYVGLSFGRGRRLSAVLRDPSGALECLVWTQDGLTLVASHAPDWLWRALRPAWRIDRGRLAQALRDPLLGFGPLLLDGPVAVPPGAVQPLPVERPSVALWTPAAFARRGLDPPPDLAAAEARVRAALDEAVCGLAALSGPVAAELSGGLDSSLVGASLVHASKTPVALWLNAYGATPEADERPYVAAVAESLGISPTCVPHATSPASEAGLEAASRGLRPGLNALDPAHDRDWAQRLSDAGATGLLTGKGGDAILLQRATTDVFIDRWLDEGWRALFHPDTVRLAAGTEVSVWTMLKAARRHRRHGSRLPLRDAPFLVPPAEDSPIHPWLEGTADLGPAKRFQIAGVIDGLARHGPSALTEAIDVRHPLCAQPVIEACLSLPTPLLTWGGRDRGLVRRAFRDRLPPLILERRSKGDMTEIYGRGVLRDLPVLRPWLLDGRLAALGLIDRVACEAALSRESLIWKGGYGAIIVTAAFEGWLRAWERRLGPA
jgi:asparagine synthase (glutamine-hydrolysing)